LETHTELASEHRVFVRGVLKRHVKYMTCGVLVYNKKDVEMPQLTGDAAAVARPAYQHPRASVDRAGPASGLVRDRGAAARAHAARI